MNAAVTSRLETPDPVDVHVGARLRARRTLLGMTQEKLAETVGLTFQQIQKYERGTNRMGASRLFQFAKVLGTSVAFFFEDMVPALASPGLAEDGQDELQDLTANDDILSRRETLDLVRAYYKINDIKQRKKVLDLIKSMAES